MQIGCYVNVTSRLFSSADNHPPRRLLELNLYIHFPNILLERLQGSCLMLSCLQAVIRQKGSSPSSSDCISFVPFLWSDRALALSSSSPSYKGVCFNYFSTRQHTESCFLDYRCGQISSFKLWYICYNCMFVNQTYLRQKGLLMELKILCAIVCL